MHPSSACLLASQCPVKRGVSHFNLPYTDVAQQARASVVVDCIAFIAAICCYTDHAATASLAGGMFPVLAQQPWPGYRSSSNEACWHRPFLAMLQRSVISISMQGTKQPQRCTNHLVVVVCWYNTCRGMLARCNLPQTLYYVRCQSRRHPHACLSAQGMGKWHLPRICMARPQSVNMLQEPFFLSVGATCVCSFSAAAAMFVLTFSIDSDI